MKIKHSKSEKETFLDKEFLMTITVPIKFINDRRIDRVVNKYKSIPLSLVYSKNAKKHMFYHCYFGVEDIIFSELDNVKALYSPMVSELFKELSQIIYKNEKEKK